MGDVFIHQEDSGLISPPVDIPSGRVAVDRSGRQDLSLPTIRNSDGAGGIRVGIDACHPPQKHSHTVHINQYRY